LGLTFTIIVILYNVTFFLLNYNLTVIERLETLQLSDNTYVFTIVPSGRRTYAQEGWKRG
jgi:hypothetical protein